MRVWNLAQLKLACVVLCSGRYTSSDSTHPVYTSVKSTRHAETESRHRKIPTWHTPLLASLASL